MRVKKGKGYLISVCYDSDFYINGAEHIERDDYMEKYPSDEMAAKAAENDGVKLIYGMKDVPDGVYIDSKANRALITKELKNK